VKNVPCFLAIICLCCAPPADPKAAPSSCSDTSLAALEASYVAEALSACEAERADYDSCRALPGIRLKYQARRVAFVECP